MHFPRAQSRANIARSAACAMLSSLCDVSLLPRRSLSILPRPCPPRARLASVFLAPGVQCFLSSLALSSQATCFPLNSYHRCCALCFSVLLGFFISGSAILHAMISLRANDLFIVNSSCCNAAISLPRFLPACIPSGMACTRSDPAQLFCVQFFCIIFVIDSSLSFLVVHDCTP